MRCLVLLTSGILLTHTARAQNDDCLGAGTITCGQTITDSTTAATDDLVDDCVTSVSAPGVWYDFTGTGGWVLLSTCGGSDYDTKLNVYTGDCDSLICVDGNDDSEFCGLNSEVLLATVSGTVYHVLVQGYDGETGIFTLTMDCPTCVPPQGTYITQSDTEADVYWTTFNSGSDYIVEYGPSGFTPGTGTTITGTVGIDGPPAHITGLTPGTDYDVYMSEDCGGSSSVEIGPYGFTTNTDPPPVNAFCGDALPITCGTDLFGTTVNSVYTPGPTCGSADINTQGVWYGFTGTGDDALLSTCNQAGYDTKISVFTGPCTALVCAGGNDDGPGCGTTSQVLLATSAGTDYLVLVHGYNGASGTFTLSMLCAPGCAPMPANDECANAQTVLPQLSGSCAPLQATNICAYASPLPNPPCDPFANIADMWYTFNTGANTDVTITVEALSAAEINFALYENCGSPNYIDCFIETTGPIDFTGLDTNTDYLVRIWNGGVDDAGTFSLCIEADLGTGVAEAITTEAALFPNPAIDALNVRDLSPGTTCAIMDAQGRVLRLFQATGTTIDVSALAPGAYLLRVEGRSMPFVKGR